MFQLSTRHLHHQRSLHCSFLIANTSMHLRSNDFLLVRRKSLNRSNSKQNTKIIIIAFFFFFVDRSLTEIIVNSLSLDLLNHFENSEREAEKKR